MEQRLMGCVALICGARQGCQQFQLDLSWQWGCTTSPNGWNVQAHEHDDPPLNVENNREQSLAPSTNRLNSFVTLDLWCV